MFRMQGQNQIVFQEHFDHFPFVFFIPVLYLIFIYLETLTNKLALAFFCNIIRFLYRIYPFC